MFGKMPKKVFTFTISKNNKSSFNRQEDESKGYWLCTIPNSKMKHSEKYQAPRLLLQSKQTKSICRAPPESCDLTVGNRKNLKALLL